MAKKRGKKKKKAPDSVHGLRRFVLLVRRFIITCLLVLAILYVLAFGVARTGGFRSLVAERLESRLGLPVSIGESRADWKLDLTFRWLQTGHKEKARKAGMSVQNMKVKWSLGKLLAGEGGLAGVTLDGCNISFQPSADGQGWEPEALGALSGWVLSQLGLKLDTAVARSPAGPRDGARARREQEMIARWANINLDLAHGDLDWLDERGRRVAYVNGIRLRATPVILPGRHMTHYDLSIAEIRAGGGPVGRNLQLEALRTGGHTVILGFTADRHTPGRQRASVTRPPRLSAPAPRAPAPSPRQAVEPPVQRPAARVVPSPAPPSVQPAPAEAVRLPLEPERLEGDAEEEFTAYIRDILSDALKESPGSD